MDAKEIKALLKQAREAIKKKDYKTAIKHCKAVLKADQENYNAWVFIAAATQETGQLVQAETAFNKAIEICPEQLLAWQGMATFYEKQNEPLKQMDVLIKMSGLLANDKAKRVEIIDKLTTLLASVNDKQKEIEVLQLQLEIIENEPEKEYQIWYKMFKEICAIPDLNASMHKLRAVALGNLVGNPLFTENERKGIISIFSGPQCAEGFSDENTQLIKSMCWKFPNSECCLEFLLKDAVNSYINLDVVDENLDVILPNARDKTALYWLCDTVQAIILITGQPFGYVNAMNLLKRVLEKKTSYLIGWYLLSKVQLQLHLFKDVDESIKMGLQLAEKTHFDSLWTGKFYIFLGVALAGSKSWNSSMRALEKSVEYLGRTDDILAAFCYTLLEIEMVDKAEQICEELSSSASHDPSLVLQLEGYICLLKKEYSVALEKLKRSVQKKESAFTLHLIGRVLWEMEQPGKAFKIFFKAAELDPFYNRNFLFLGQYYILHGDDQKNARLCYQKAFDIDKSDHEVARYLSNMLRVTGDDEANFKLLKQVTEDSYPGSCKWAWTQLGLYQLERDLIAEAISSLQHAVRADPLSSYGWQCLGEAYLKRGSYESAFKAFEKASDLDSKSMYPLYQVATIQKARGLFAEAIEKFENLLELDPLYIPALIGLAETHLLLGKENIRDCLFGRARDCFQDTLNVLSRVAAINVDLLCLWSLAGNACTLCFYLGAEWFPMLMPCELQGTTQDVIAICQKEEMLMFGAKFYGQALSQKSNLSCLWQDLGVNCFFQSETGLHSSGKVEFSRKALICLKNAVFLAPTNHEHWTMLGTMAVSEDIQDYALAQHAFIKSIMIERNNAEAWANLGILYLQNDSIDLAHRSFKVAQSLDPSYPISWIGQAMIADYVQHSETVDLYRHATTLCSHAEALIGYGRNVCFALVDLSNRETELYKYNIERMDAISVAADCMKKFTANNGSCPEAFVFLGILLERRDLFNPALKAFERAVVLFNKDGKPEEVEKSRINYARLLSKVGQNENALTEYLKLKKVDTSLLCSFAFACYKDNKVEKAYEIFERAFDNCSTQCDKSHILVAMAMIAWHEGDAQKSLNLLVKSLQIQPASVFGLLALRAVCIIKNQPSIALTVQQSLLPLENNKKYSSSITLLSAIEAFNKDGVQSARNVLIKAIRRQPDNSALWTDAASCLLQWDTSLEGIAATCAEIAVLHGGNKEVASQIFALSKLAAGHKSVLLHTAQKTVHVQPDKLSNWITLAAACHISGKNRNQVGWIFSFVKKLAKQQGIKAELLGWLTVIEVYHYICCKEYSAATALLKQAVNISAFGSETLSVLEVLNEFLNVLVGDSTIDALVDAVKNNSRTFLGWQLLTQLLMKSESFDEAEKTLAEFVIATSKFFPKLSVFPLLQIAILSYKAMKVSGDYEKWMQIGEDAVGEAVKIAPNSKAARLLQGIISLETNNIGLARRSLEKIVFNADSEARWMEKSASELLTSIYVKKNDNEALEKLSTRFHSSEEISMD